MSGWLFKCRVCCCPCGRLKLCFRHKPAGKRYRQPVTQSKAYREDISAAQIERILAAGDAKRRRERWRAA